MKKVLKVSLSTVITLFGISNQVLNYFGIYYVIRCKIVQLELTIVGFVSNFSPTEYIINQKIDLF